LAGLKRGKISENSKKSQKTLAKKPLEAYN
jgi:hypothetical protein